MRVLDLGCGKAVSSVFLAREFEVQVWATDLWVPATDNAQRIADQGLSDAVFPIHADSGKWNVNGLIEMKTGLLSCFTRANSLNPRIERL